MKFQYISDLHTEFPENREFLKLNQKHFKSHGDILLVAGDLGYSLNNLKKNDDSYWSYEYDTESIIDYFDRNWKYTIIIPGNHEYYGDNSFPIGRRFAQFSKNLKPNVAIVNNKFVHITVCNKTNEIIDISFSDSIRNFNISKNNTYYTIFGSTLWSNILPEEYYMIYKYSNDYRYCKSEKGINLRIGDTVEEYLRTVNILMSNDYKRKDNEKYIILTHHLPSYDFISKEYRNTDINSMYASNLDTLIDKISPDAWVFGHSHNIRTWTKGKTKFYTSCLGYVRNSEEHPIKCLNKIFKL